MMHVCIPILLLFRKRKTSVNVTELNLVSVVENQHHDSSVCNTGSGTESALNQSNKGVEETIVSVRNNLYEPRAITR